MRILELEYIIESGPVSFYNFYQYIVGIEQYTIDLEDKLPMYLEQEPYNVILAKINYTGDKKTLFGKWCLIFDTDRDYIEFLLKWS